MNYHISPRVDIYALGVVFYQMLNGKLPGSVLQDDADELSFSHHLVAKQLVLDASNEVSIPKVVERIIAKMVNINPRERYSQVLSVCADFSRCLQQLTQAENQNNSSVRLDLVISSSEIFNFEIDSLQKSIEQSRSDRIFGREREIEKFTKAIENVTPNGSLLICISGSSGIGKSTLINHVIKKNTNKFSYIIKVKLDKYKKDSSYETLYAALRSATKKIIAQDERLLSAWRKNLNLALGVQAQVLIDVIPELEVIMGPQPAVDLAGAAETKARFDGLLLKYIQLFARQDKPLCIILDDVQWADIVLLKWLEQSVLNITNVLIVVSYRNNEVTSSHPFFHLLQTLQSLNINTVQLALSPLSKGTLVELIQDIMQLDEVEKIAEIIHQKTQGNAFFVRQYLLQLQNDEAIWYDPDALKWCYNLDKIHRLSVSDSVLDVLSARITSLPAHIRMLLDVAACIGSEFSQALLKAVYNNDSLFEDAVNGALDEEWIMESEVQHEKNEPIKSYYFSHDRMQQIIYTALEVSELQRIHLLIGDTIAKNTTKLENKSLIDSINHLNEGSALIRSVKKKEFLAELNVKSAVHAKNSGNFDSALLYIKKAMDLHANLSARKNYIAILTLRAECEQLCHNNKTAIDYYQQAIALSTSNLEKAIVYELLIKLHTDNSDFKTAYNIGCTAAMLYNLSLPSKFNKALFAVDFIKVKIKLIRKTREDILNLPEVKDQGIVVLMRILSALLKAAYQIQPELCVAISVKLVGLCLRHGNIKESVVGYMVFGVIFQGGILGAHNTGYEYAKLSLKMLNDFNNYVQRPEVQFVCGYFANSWKQPAYKTELNWAQAYKNGLSVGDWFHSGCAAAAIVQSMFMRGVSFNEILTTIEPMAITLERIGAKEQLGAIQGVKQVILALQGNTASATSLDDDDFSETTYIQSLYDYQSPHFAHYYFINKMALLYFNNKIEDALAIANKSRAFVSGSKGMLHNTEHDFYYALILLKLIPNASLIKIVQYKQKVKKIKNNFFKWAKNCPENFIVRASILAGAECQLKLKTGGNAIKALKFYEAAISSAIIYGQTPLIAIANAMAGNVYHELEQPKVAAMYCGQESSSLQKWGALSLPALNSKKQEVFSAYSVKDGNFDIATVMKVAEAITKEQSLSHLLRTLMNIIIEHAGAQHGVLLLQKNNLLMVQAEALIDNDIVNMPHEKRFDQCENIIHSVVNYVLRSKDAIVIDNMQNSSIFSSEKGVKERNVKAVLCVPLMLHGVLRGVIYLENNLMPGIFTDEKLALLKHLSGQIVISIENARVYHQLEQRVDERTRDLDTQNDELERKNVQLQQQNSKILELNVNIIKENVERKSAEEKLQVANSKLDLLASTDSLTNLHNRRSFDRYIEQVCKSISRHQEPLSLIMCDVDYFKKYNDHYGHQKGDWCLQQIASILNFCAKRPTDFVARYGGEEFIIVMPHTNKEDALAIAKNIHATLKKAKLSHKESPISEHITVSIGLCVSSEVESNSPKIIIKNADTALYQAKSLGRNRTM